MNEYLIPIKIISTNEMGFISFNQFRNNKEYFYFFNKDNKIIYPNVVHINNMEIVQNE